jgi:hypothetical protein
VDTPIANYLGLTPGWSPKSPRPPFSPQPPVPPFRHNPPSPLCQKSPRPPLLATIPPSPPSRHNPPVPPFDKGGRRGDFWALIASGLALCQAGSIAEALVEPHVRSAPPNADGCRDLLRNQSGGGVGITGPLFLLGSAHSGGSRVPVRQRELSAQLPYLGTLADRSESSYFGSPFDFNGLRILATNLLLYKGRLTWSLQDPVRTTWQSSEKAPHSKAGGPAWTRGDRPNRHRIIFLPERPCRAEPRARTTFPSTHTHTHTTLISDRDSDSGTSPSIGCGIHLRRLCLHSVPRTNLSCLESEEPRVISARRAGSVGFSTIPATASRATHAEDGPPQSAPVRRPSLWASRLVRGAPSPFASPARGEGREECGAFERCGGGGSA